MEGRIGGERGDVRAVVEGFQESFLVVDNLLELGRELFAGEGVFCCWGPTLDGGGVVGTGHLVDRRGDRWRELAEVRLIMWSIKLFRVKHVSKSRKWKCVQKDAGQ